MPKVQCVHSLGPAYGKTHSPDIGDRWWVMRLAGVKKMSTFAIRTFTGSQPGGKSVELLPERRRGKGSEDRGPIQDGAEDCVVGNQPRLHSHVIHEYDSAV